LAKLLIFSKMVLKMLIVMLLESSVNGQTAMALTH
jgi:hypothetical protein